MTICHTTKCEVCGTLFLATYNEDQPIPERCSSCDAPEASSGQSTPSITPIDALITPSESDSIDWDRGWKDYD